MRPIAPPVSVCWRSGTARQGARHVGAIERLALRGGAPLPGSPDSIPAPLGHRAGTKRLAADRATGNGPRRSGTACCGPRDRSPALMLAPVPTVPGSRGPRGRSRHRPRSWCGGAAREGQAAGIERLTLALAGLAGLEARRPPAIAGRLDAAVVAPYSGGSCAIRGNA